MMGDVAQPWSAQMLERYYDEYRGIARAILARDSAAVRINPTELAHDAAIRLFRLERMDVGGRTHFLSLAARVMRQVLIDEVRRFRADKRQAPQTMTQWPGAGDDEPGLDLEALDDALARLQAADAERGWIVEQRFYGGLTLEEIAAVSGRSLSTVKRQWRVARAWLIGELSRD